MYEPCGYRLNLSLHLDFSEAEIYISLNANPKPHIFQLYSAHLIKDKSDERRESHAMCIWEPETATWTQHSAPERWHKTPLVPSGPLQQGLATLPRPSASGKQLLSCAQGQSSSPAEKGRRAGQSKGAGAVLWLCGLRGKAYSLLCSAVRLCRLLSHLCSFALAGPPKLQEI